MSKMSPRKLKKKKAHEKEAHQKVLSRRAALRAPKIEANKERKKMKRVGKLIKDMDGLNQWADEIFMKMSDKTLSQLEHNAQILKGLEAEWQQEKDKKQKLNSSLESKGLFELQDKLNFLHNELVDQQKAAGIEILGEDWAVTQETSPAKKSRKEVAEVTICKAPGFEDQQKESQSE